MICWQNNLKMCKKFRKILCNLHRKEDHSSKGESNHVVYGLPQSMAGHAPS